MKIKKITQKNTEDITGQRFHKLVAIKKEGRNTRNQVLWLFKCDCGNKTLKVKTKVMSGGIKSCGCPWSRLQKLSFSQIQEITHIYLHNIRLTELGQYYNVDHSTIFYHIHKINNTDLTLSPKCKKIIKIIKKQRQIQLEISKVKILEPKTYKEYMLENKKRELKIQQIVSLSKELSIPKLVKQFKLSRQEIISIIKKYKRSD